MLEGCGKVQARAVGKFSKAIRNERPKKGKFTGSLSLPLPAPLKAATGTEFTKCVCKILIPKGSKY
jgi:hypothetical protein